MSFSEFVQVAAAWCFFVLSIKLFGAWRFQRDMAARWKDLADSWKKGYYDLEKVADDAVAMLKEKSK